MSESALDPSSVPSSNDVSSSSARDDTTDALLPVDALQRLVDRVVQKFTQGDIGLDEAASRLVGTGRFEENAEALDFLRQDVCPRLEDRLHGIEEEIAALQAEVDRIRGVLGIGVTAPPAPTSPSAYVPTGKGRKEKAAPEKKRKGAERAESIWDAHAEAAAPAPASTPLATDGTEASLAAAASVWDVQETPDARETAEPTEASSAASDEGDANEESSSRL